MREILPMLAAVLWLSAGCGPTRNDVLRLARAYVEHEWSAGPANALHGPDPQGIQVDTPDDGYREGGWHLDGRANRGLPYQWGGDSTPEEFDAGLRAGRPAGHVVSGRTPSHRPQESQYPVGVDCSGFITRCWGLPERESTRSLFRVADALPSYLDLKPGDILNRYDKHVLLFVGWCDEEKTRLRAY